MQADPPMVVVVLTIFVVVARGRGRRFSPSNRPQRQLCNRPGHMEWKCFQKFNQNFVSPFSIIKLSIWCGPKKNYQFGCLYDQISFPFPPSGSVVKFGSIFVSLPNPSPSNQPSSVGCSVVLTKSKKSSITMLWKEAMIIRLWGLKLSKDIL